MFTVSVHQKVKVNEMPWFHGKIAREKAEELLNAQNSPDGVFLVRESYNFPGDYTLCVCYQGKVEHYRVIAKKNSLTIDEEEKFENLTQLVSHYMKDADGLCTKLTEPKRNSDSKIAYHDVNFRVRRRFNLTNRLSIIIGLICIFFYRHLKMQVGKSRLKILRFWKNSAKESSEMSC